MKKTLLISASLLTLSVVTGIYAQSVGATGSIVDKMKAVAHSFTLGSILNPSDTGLTSDPVKGKKTGDILTAGEYNRLLELLSEGGGGGGAGWVDVPLTDTNPFDRACEYRFTINTNGDHASKSGPNPLFHVAGVDSFALTYTSHSGIVSHILASSKNIYRVDGVEAYTVTKIEKLCGGSGGTSGGTGEMVMSEMSPTAYANLIDAVNYCRNLTENGITNWKFPTYGDLVNFIDVKYSQDMVWVADFDTSVINSTNITKDYFASIRLSDGYWSVSTLADGANKVRCVAQTGGGGSSGGSGWVDVPLTGTENFDDSCMYRFQITYTAGGREPHVPKETYYYANGISKTQLVWWLDNDSQLSTFHITASSKNIFRINGAPYNAVGGNPEVSIIKIEKLCGGGGGNGSTGTSNITWANFDGSGGVAMKGSNGISSIVRVSGGNYRVTFTTPKANTDYGVICTAGTSPAYLCYPHEKTTSSFLIMTGNSWANADASFVSLIVTPFDVGTGSGVSGSSWADIGLTGNTPFDINCEYRFKVSAPGNTDDDGFIGDDNAYNYIQRVHANRLTYQHIGTSYEHINADTKTTLRQNGTPTSPAQTITQIQKRCN